MANRKNYFLLFRASAEDRTVLLPFPTENNDFRVCFYYSAGDSRNKVISAQVGLLLCLQFVHKMNTVNFRLEAQLGLYRRGF